jgi:hypothetical protein
VECNRPSDIKLREGEKGSKQEAENEIAGKT